MAAYEHVDRSFAGAVQERSANIRAACRDDASLTVFANVAHFRDAALRPERRHYHRDIP
jgi:hypothetical protein